MNVSHPFTVRARELRRMSTPAEKKLWIFLRSRQLFPLHQFRRQVPIYPYILDFYCFSQKLAIELDGSPHTDEKRKIYDGERTKFFEEKGIRVIRFWNREVIERPEKVLKIIEFNLFNTSHIMSPKR